MVTKSGSNTMSGSAWEFNRDDALQARNFFAPQTQPKPELKQNQFGVALGGPMLRNRLFGFGFYEGYRNDSGITQNILVLSEAQRNGDFSGGAAIRDPLTGLPFPGNVIPSNRISAPAAQLLREFVPLPNSPGNRYIVSPTVSDVRDHVRRAVRLSPRQQPDDPGPLHAQHHRSRHATHRRADRSAGPGHAAGRAHFAQLRDQLERDQPGAVLDQPHHRESRRHQRVEPARVTGSISPTPTPLAAGLPSFAVAGFFGGGNAALGDAQQPFVDRVNHVWQVANDLTWISGRHSLKFGADVRREAMRIAFINRPNGDLTFSGGLSGNAAADFLLGLPAQARATTQQAIQEGYGFLFAGYAQDEFRAHVATDAEPRRAL